MRGRYSTALTTLSHAAAAAAAAAPAAAAAEGQGSQLREYLRAHPLPPRRKRNIPSSLSHAAAAVAAVAAAAAAANDEAATKAFSCELMRGTLRFEKKLSTGDHQKQQ